MNPLFWRSNKVAQIVKTEHALGLGCQTRARRQAISLFGETKFKFSNQKMIPSFVLDSAYSKMFILQQDKNDRLLILALYWRISRLLIFFQGKAFLQIQKAARKRDRKKFQCNRKPFLWNGRSEFRNHKDHLPISLLNYGNLSFPLALFNEPFS